jgi:hypothetical protein
MASNGAASMPTRAVVTTNRAMISSPRGAVRQQILRRDCEAGQWPAAGSAVSMPSFLRVQSGGRARGDLNFTIASDLGRNVTRDRFRAPTVAESARIALPYGITICQNRGDTSAHTRTRAPDLPRPGLLFFAPARRRSIRPTAPSQGAAQRRAGAQSCNGGRGPNAPGG